MYDPDEFENTLVAERGEVYEEVRVEPVKLPPSPDWNLHNLFNIAKRSAPEGERRTWVQEQLNRLDPQELDALRHRWTFWARSNQLAPSGMWTFWLLLAGRGFGKTRTGAEWVNERVQQGVAKRIALVAPTAHDARKVMVEGESGILAISPPWNRPVFSPANLQLTWPNGAIAQLFSAEEPERLRGPQCDTFWADELASWKKMQDTWDMLQFGFRLGYDPRGVITTTPKPLPIIKELIGDDRDLPDRLRPEDWGGQSAVTRGSTYDNKANLSPKFYATVVKKYEGTRLGRQELDAEILDDMPGALWNRPSLDANRISGVPPFPQIIKNDAVIPGIEMQIESADVLARAAAMILNRVPEDLVRIVVAVDPNASNDEGSDEIGITVSGKGVGGTGYVLADISMRGSPNEWGSAAVMAYDAFKADRVIAEVNNGGNMVEHVVHTAAKSLKDLGKRASDFVSYTAVHASRGKVTRAEPVSALYEQNRIVHVGTHKVLEDQMCLFTLDFDRKAMGYSPDRVDSLVWGFTHLFLEDQDSSGLFEHMRREVARIQGVANDNPTQEDWVRMKVPLGINTVSGREGDMYTVKDGHVTVKPDDVPPLRMAGFLEG